MNYNAVIKEIPEYIMYCKSGVIADWDSLVEFIHSAADECLAANPDMECDDSAYNFITYPNGFRGDGNILLEYYEAVKAFGNETKSIKFKKIEKTKAVCVLHKGSYEGLKFAYAFAFQYLKENGYAMSEPPRECYIDGCWNKESVSEYLTEIQIPVDL